MSTATVIILIATFTTIRANDQAASVLMCEQSILVSLAVSKSGFKSTTSNILLVPSSCCFMTLIISQSYMHSNGASVVMPL